MAQTVREPFPALRIHQTEKGVEARLEDLRLEDLSPGEVVIRVAYSSVNYKDALAATGRARILRRYPLVGGIDAAGVVVSSQDPRFREGDPVLVTGCGLSEVHDGGYAAYLRVPGDWVIPLPEGLDGFQAMALGTAGFTAALALIRMEANGQRPEMGPIVVTGATGGVGSLAVDLFARRGYEVVAVTGKPEAEGYLKDLGASRVLLRQDLSMGSRPLERALWGGAVDNVGGEMLAWLTRTTRPWGNIVSIGLAGGSELHTTVMPFILRGVCLLGVTAANCPLERRREVWTRLAGDLRPACLDRIVSRVVGLRDLMPVFQEMLEGRTRGRTVVRIQPEKP